jgi:glycosyltransferase involved in cell wall biosynthesis
MSIDAGKSKNPPRAVAEGQAGAASAPTRILHSITGLNVGGAELMLVRLLASMDRHRFEPRVFSLLAPGLVSKRVSNLDVEVDSIGMGRGIPKVSEATRLWNYGSSVQADFIQGWMYHGSLAATLFWWRKSRKPRLAWNIRHSLSDIALEPRLTRQIIRLLARFSRAPGAIIYCSQVSRKQHEALGFASDRGVLIANGFDTELFRPDLAARERLRNLAGAPQGAVLAGVVARVDPMKDHANLLKAAAVLRAQGHPIYLVFMGRDADENNADLIGSIREHGLMGAISLLAIRDDVPKLLPGLDILVSPSAWGEAFPNAVGEAMACGVPCVVTDVGDSRWVVGDTGVVVPPRDPTALAAALLKLMSLSEEGRQQMGQKARERVLKEFALAKMTAAYERLYDDLLRR